MKKVNWAKILIVKAFCRIRWKSNRLASSGWNLFRTFSNESKGEIFFDPNKSGVCHFEKKIHNYFFKVVSFSGNRHELINPSRVPTIRITMKQSRISFDHVTQKMSNGGFVYSSCGFFSQKKIFFGENK